MISKLIERLKKSKKHRELFVTSQVKNDIPFQIRALRDTEGWTQAELGRRLEMPQSVISRMENPDSGFLSIKTLLRVASVFDVALVVRFVPFGELIHWVESVPYEVKGLSPQALAPLKFDKDPMFQGSLKVEQSASSILDVLSRVNQDLGRRQVSITVFRATSPIKDFAIWRSHFWKESEAISVGVIDPSTRLNYHANI